MKPVGPVAGPGESSSESHSSKRYYAFISYTNANLRAASKLHRQLETYRLPKRLMGRTGRTGIEVPKRLYPCYLDKEELAGESDLSQSIYSAIGQSRSIVVVCSPIVRHSKWVEAEILYARSRRIATLAWIVDGAPPDCFPSALHQASEPAACDGRGSRRSYRRELLRLIAAVLAIDLNELIRRDLERRRHHTLMAGAALCAVAVIAVVLVTEFARRQRLNESRRQAAASTRVMDTDPEEAVRLAIAAMEASGTPEAEQAISQAIDSQRTRAHFDHGHSVKMILFSGDGGTLLSAGDLGKVGLWDATNGSARFRLRGLSGTINAIALSADGTLAAAGDSTGLLLVWNTNTGQVVAKLDHGGKQVESLVFLPDGNTIISTTDGGSLHAWRLGNAQPVWQRRVIGFAEVIGAPAGGTLFSIEKNGTVTEIDVVTGAVRKVLLPDRARFRPGTEHQWTAAAVAHDRKHVAIGYRDGRIWIISIADKKGRWLASPHTGEINSVKFAPDGRYLASGAADNSVVVWNREDWTQIDRDVHKKIVFSVAYSPDGGLLATASEDRTIALRSPVGALLTILRGHRDGVFQVLFSPDGQTLASASRDGTIRLWRVNLQRAAPPLVHPQRIDDTCVSADGKLLLAVGRSFAWLWDTDAWNKVSEQPAGRLTRVVCAQSGESAAAGDADGNVEMFRIGPKGLESFWKTPTHDSLQALAISADGELLITAGSERIDDIISNRLKFWNTRTGERLHSFAADQGPISEIGFTPSDSQVFSVSLDGTLKFWSRNDASPVRTVSTTAPSRGLVRAVFRRFGDDVLTADQNGTIRLWDLKTASEKWFITGQKTDQAPLSFSLDEKSVWTVTSNGFTRLTDPLRPEPPLLSVPSGLALSFAFSPSDGRFATADGGSTSVWDRQTGIKLHNLLGGKPRFWRSELLVSTIYGRGILIYDLSSTELLARARKSFATRAHLPN